MKFRIRARYLVDIDAQIDAHDMTDAIEQAGDATAADLVTPRDGVTIRQSVRVSLEVAQVAVNLDAPVDAE